MGREMAKISMEELDSREKEVSSSLSDYKKMNRELKQKLENAERDKRQKIEDLEKQSHINWMAQKDMEREWAAAMQESDDSDSDREPTPPMMPMMPMFMPMPGMQPSMS